MPNIQRYVTWKRKMVDTCCYKDPNTDDRVFSETNWGTTFIETPYQIADWRFISLVEYPDTCTQQEIDYFKTLDPAFEFTFIDETTANTLLSELWDVTVTNWVFSDNRPVTLP
jgi:hypothetical protein